jgi:hypothetical protein
MKIELKKISFNERMSEETNCFVADLYINGKKVGYVKNDGRGGCTDYYGDSPENNQLIREAEAYYKTLPMAKCEEYNFDYQPTLEGAIDEQFELYLKAKEEKKMSKLFQIAIVVGKPKGASYRYMKFKQPLSGIPQTKLVFYVAKMVNEHCHDGVELLNTNFKFENGKVIFV